MTEGTGAIIDLKALIDQLPIAVCFCEAPSGLIRLYNRRAAELWGREPAPGEQRYSGAVRLFRTDGSHLPHAETPMAEVLLFGGERNEDIVIERPDGLRVAARENVTAVCDSKGRIVGAVNTFQEVTERRKYEDDAARLAAIIQSADDAIISKTLEGRITSWNRAAEAMFGYTEAEALGKSITIIIPPERLSEEEVIIDRLRRGEVIEHFETERVAKDGRRVHISLTISPIKDRHGRILGASKVARDITDRRRLEREREDLLARERDARADAEAASRTKDEMLAMLSHELRDPLGVIGTSVRVLATTKQDATSARVQAIISRQVDHLARLASDLLEVGRATAGKIALDRRPLDLAEVTGGVVSAWRASGRLSRHRVTLQAVPVWVEADETRLEQVVANLLGNALKFTPENGAVSVSVRADAGTAVLEVQDTGIGISAELIGRIFDLFAQGTQVADRTHGGLGIGLTLVRRLVEQHGGAVIAQSAGLGRGSVFTVRLPAIEPPSPAPESPRQAVAPRRVLIVEDNDDAREMMRFALELEGHTVFTASDGSAGIALAVSESPDIAFIDIGLPGFDGYEVARRLRAATGKALTLVALSGYGAANDRERGEHAGFDIHLVKPVEPTRLADVIAASPRQPDRTHSSADGSGQPSPEEHM